MMITLKLFTAGADKISATFLCIISHNAVLKSKSPTLTCRKNLFISQLHHDVIISSDDVIASHDRAEYTSWHGMRSYLDISPC